MIDLLISIDHECRLYVIGEPFDAHGQGDFRIEVVPGRYINRIQQSVRFDNIIQQVESICAGIEDSGIQFGKGLVVLHNLPPISTTLPGFGRRLPRLRSAREMN